MVTHRDFVMKCFHKFMRKEGTHFKKGSKLLDIGCRNDKLKKNLENFGFVWTGQDLKEGTGVDIVCPMEEMYNIESETYDLIFCCHALEHCEDPINALKEFKRVLKPRGKVFIATPYPCMEQIIEGDKDHLFVLGPMNWDKLMIWVGFKNNKSVVDMGKEERQQDWNVITVGEK